jgi:hypothetical protein
MQAHFQYLCSQIFLMVYIFWIGTLCLHYPKGITQTLKNLECMQYFIVGISHMPWVETLCLNCPKDIA